MSFVHLRAHSEYSVVDGTLRIDEAAAAARAHGMPALALTDLNNLFGAVKFYKACRGKGVKPVLGVDVWMEPLAAAAAAAGPAASAGARHPAPNQPVDTAPAMPAFLQSGDKAASRLLLLVQNEAGWHHLSELLARAWVHNAQRTVAWVKWAWLEELGGGLIALSGADLGAVGTALLAGDEARAKAVAQHLMRLFPGRFYVELQRAGQAQQEAHVRAAVPLAAALGLPVVATHPIQFLEPDDYEAHEARVCVAEGETLANPRRLKRFTREQHFKSAAEMARLFADVPSALANSGAIAKRCNVTLKLGQARLPDFPTPLGPDGRALPIEAYFRQQAAARRLSSPAAAC